MKFLHTADWHLGYRQYGMAVREADFMRPLDEIATVAVRERVDAVVVAGDMFDNARPPASAVQAAKEFGRKMGAAGIPVLSIDGNHDLSGGKWARLCGFVPLEQDTAEGTPMYNAGGVWFAGIDFCRTQQLLEKLKALKERGCDLHGGVMVLHMEIAEMTAYSTAMSLRDLEPLMEGLGAGYVALGHIHNAVAAKSELGRDYVYPGSTEMNDISELGLKYVNIVERVDGAGWRTTPLALFAPRKFEVVDVETADGIDEKLAPVLASPDTFWLVKVNLSAPGKLISRVESALKDRLYRILPYGNRTIEEQVERKNVVVGLKDAIGKFFGADTDEASLISRIIDTPEQAKAIMDEYVNNKETK